MKNNLLSFVAVAFIVTLNTTSCTKENDSFTKELPTIDLQTAIVGSWQLIQKSAEMNPTHICTYNGIKWQNTKDDESQEFKQNGEYSCYLKKQLGCKGSYRISNEGDLDINSNCQNNTVKIAGLTTIFLTVKDGNTYFKYRKIE